MVFKKWNRVCNFQNKRLISEQGGEMIYRVFLGVIVLMLASKHSLGNTTLNPVLVEVPIQKSFVPMGFDSNDRVQLAIGGELRNSCYKIASNSVVVDPDQKIITVKQQAYVYLGFCLMMIVPYSEVVTLGIVDKPGDYQIRDASSGKTIGKIKIDLARTLEQDEFLYAPVSDAVLVKDEAHESEESPERNKIVLTGTFVDACTQLKEVRVSQNENTIVVQPIAVVNQQMGDCKTEKINFSKTVVLDPKLRGDYLLHVRALNGAAINKVIDFGN